MLLFNNITAMRKIQKKSANPQMRLADVMPIMINASYMFLTSTLQLIE